MFEFAMQFYHDLHISGDLFCPLAIVQRIKITKIGKTSVGFGVMKNVTKSGFVDSPHTRTDFTSIE